MMLSCIDVSHHQGPIDWKKVRDSGISNVIVRASIWLMEDTFFKENVEGATAAGLNVGAYHYACAEDEAEALREAGFFLQAIAPYKLALPVAYDFEDPKRHSGMGKEQSAAIVKAFLARVEAAGYYVMLYATASWMGARFSSLDQYDKWVAHVDVDRPAYNGNFGIWQYSWEGRVNGIACGVDMNHVYRDYPALIKAAGLNGWGARPEKPDPGALYEAEKRLRLKAEGERDAALAKLAQIKNIIL